MNREPGTILSTAFSGLVYHVIQHTAHLRSQFLQPEETEDIAADIMEELARSDYAVLRQFRGNSSLASFLTVIARRICVADLIRRHPVRETHLAGYQQFRACPRQGRKRRSSAQEFANRRTRSTGRSRQTAEEAAGSRTQSGAALFHRRPIL